MIWIDSRCNRRYPYERGQGRFDTGLEGDVTTRVRCCTAGFEGGGEGPVDQGMQPWKLERARTHSPPGTSAGECRHAPPSVPAPFGLLASRTVRELICVVLSHRVCGNLL